MLLQVPVWPVVSGWLRPMEPRDTYCCAGVICSSIDLMPATMLAMSVAPMLWVRSATTATSIGFGATVPQEPLQATEIRLPVLPLGIPPAGANANGTSRPW